MNQFTNYVELQAEKAENLSFCRGIKLLHIRDKVETMLGFIGKGGIFEEYTVHSIEHIDEMLKIVEWLIPDITKEKMTYAEWLMLTLAIYFHDLGMVVTKDEFEHRDETGFKEYKEKVLENTEEFEYEECAKERGDSFLYQEFVRENHAARIRQWIEGKNARNLGEAEAVCQEIEDILKNLDKMFKADLAMICESHHKDDIEDFSKYKVKKMYGNTENEKVNLNYIAIILRTADLLHITRDRTPSVARRLINVSNPVSVLEWEKQMAVRAVRPKDQRNEEGVVDNSKQKDTIEITAYFDGAETAEAYFGLSSYLQYTRKELAKCCEIVEKAQKREGAVGYALDEISGFWGHVGIKLCGIDKYMWYPINSNTRKMIYKGIDEELMVIPCMNNKVLFLNMSNIEDITLSDFDADTPSGKNWDEHVSCGEIPLVVYEALEDYEENSQVTLYNDTENSTELYKYLMEYVRKNGWTEEDIFQLLNTSVFYYLDGRKKSTIIDFYQDSDDIIETIEMVYGYDFTDIEQNFMFYIDAHDETENFVNLKGISMMELPLLKVEEEIFRRNDQ